MIEYEELIRKHQKVLSNFPQFFAFIEEQFKEGLTKLNTTKKELLSTGLGGFIRKSDRKKYSDMWIKFNKESKEALKDPNHLYQAFRYELNNHEYCYTRDVDDTLKCIGLNFEDLTAEQLRIFNKAEKDYLKAVEDII